MISTERRWPKNSISDLNIRRLKHPHALLIADILETRVNNDSGCIGLDVLDALVLLFDAPLVVLLGRGVVVLVAWELPFAIDVLEVGGARGELASRLLRLEFGEARVYCHAYFDSFFWCAYLRVRDVAKADVALALVVELYSDAGWWTWTFAVVEMCPNLAIFKVFLKFLKILKVFSKFFVLVRNID